MSKKRKFEAIDIPIWPNKPASNETDWTICILCQKTTDEALVTPMAASYISLAEHLLAFDEFDSLPQHLHNINDGSGFQETLQRNKAIFHKNCRNKFNQQKLERISKNNLWC